jgi:hypothetical protein
MGSLRGLRLRACRAAVLWRVFSLYALTHPRPAAPTTPSDRRLVFASTSATSDKSASFYASCGAGHFDHFLALVLAIGHSGARLRKAYGAAGPRPTNGSDLSASQVRQPDS